MNPLYYVTFTTATLCASFILFQGFNTTDPINTISLLCGFLVIFSGVYLLNLSRKDPEGQNLLGTNPEDTYEGIPTDGIAGFTTRRSMQARRSSVEAHGRGSLALGDREGLMRAYDVEANASGFGLDELAEDSDEDDGKISLDGRNNRSTQSNRLSGSGRARVERENMKTARTSER